MEIIPWKCHVCGREFETIRGGLCRICNRPTCTVCFGKSKGAQSVFPIQADNPTCIVCKKRMESNGDNEKPLSENSRHLGNMRKRIKEIEDKALKKIMSGPQPDDVA